MKKDFTLKKRVLGIDPGTVMGFSMVSVSIAPALGEASFFLDGLGTIDLRPSSSIPRGGVFSSALELLRSATGEAGIDAVVCEKMFHRGAGTETLIGIASVVEMFAYNSGAKYGSAQVAALKKWATGNGRAGKREMVTSARFRLRSWGEKPPGSSAFDDNAADAFHLARAGAVWIAESKLKNSLAAESPHGCFGKGFYLSGLGKQYHRSVTGVRRSQ